MQTWDPEIAIAGKFRKHIDTEQESEVKKLNDRIEILEKALQTARDEAFTAGMEEGKESLKSVEMAISEINDQGGVKVGDKKRPFAVKSIDLRDAAAGVPVPEALRVLADAVDEMVLVSDEEIKGAMQLLYRLEGIITEPAGAVSLAAASKLAIRMQGKTLATLICGNNIDPAMKHKWLG